MAAAMCGWDGRHVRRVRDELFSATELTELPRILSRITELKFATEPATGLTPSVRVF